MNRVWWQDARDGEKESQKDLVEAPAGVIKYVMELVNLSQGHPGPRCTCEKDAKGLCDKIADDCPVERLYNFEVQRLLETAKDHIEKLKKFKRLRFSQVEVLASPPTPPHPHPKQALECSGRWRAAARLASKQGVCRLTLALGGYLRAAIKVVLDNFLTSPPPAGADRRRVHPNGQDCVQGRARNPREASRGGYHRRHHNRLFPARSHPKGTVGAVTPRGRI